MATPTGVSASSRSSSMTRARSCALRRSTSASARCRAVWSRLKTATPATRAVRVPHRIEGVTKHHARPLVLELHGLACADRPRRSGCGGIAPRSAAAGRASCGRRRPPARAPARPAAVALASSTRPFAIQQPDRLGHGVEHRRRPALALAQRLLGPRTLGDVANHAQQHALPADASSPASSPPPGTSDPSRR